MAGTPVTSADITAATPASRDRYVDFLRLASICVVAAGHWLLALMILYGDGGLSQRFEMRMTTWLFQVMPLFFAVGGFAHAKALASARRRGSDYAQFLRSRTRRLLPPVAVLLAIWLVITAGLQLADVERGPYQLVGDRVTTPLWFIGVYLLVIMCAPVTEAAHRRYGVAALAGLVGVAVGLDLLWRLAGTSWASAVNLLVVWLAVHQLGYLWADGTLTRRWVPAGLAVGGFALTALLTFVSGWYTVLMVGLPGDPVSNMVPPNVALLTHAVGILGLALTLRGPLERWLRRPHPWAAVVAGNAAIMTIFCWHLTAAYAVQGLLMLTGVRPPATGTAAWWAVVPVWIAGCAVVLLGLVAVFRRFEQPPPARPASATPAVSAQPAAPAAAPVSGSAAATRPAPAWLAATGTLMTALGIFAVSQVGLDGHLTGATERVVWVDIAAWHGLLALLVGVGLLALARVSAGRPGE